MKKFVPLAGVIGWLAFGDWLSGLAFAVLAFVWVMLPAEEGPPVLALAATMQWVSVTIGFFYVTITGRTLEATISADYRTMVLIGLGCVFVMTLGLFAGRYLIERLKAPTGIRPANALSFKTLLLAYVIGTASIGIVQQSAWMFGGFAQGLIALTYLRLGLVYLIFRRLVAKEQWYYVIALLVVEIVMGITGFYAGFREPLIMAVLAFLEYFDVRKARHWITIGALGVVMATLGIAWIGVRVDYRSKWMSDERFSANRSARVALLQDSINTWASQSSEDLWTNIDSFVDRVWTVYYPALAVARVPSSIPHTDGALMWDTLQFVFEPRLFFPDKPSVKSDSEMVRKYSGIQVAGEEQDTDIAFGYAAESYIDFGIPMMFLPIFIWALFIGTACALIFREYRHRDLAVSVVVVIGWLSLYLFERSWTKTIGLGGTLLIYAGGLCYLLDRLWFEKFRKAYLTSGVDADGEPLDIDEDELAPVLQLQPQSK